MIANINRHKNFLYTHEVRDFLLSVVIHTWPQVAHPMVRVPMFSWDTLKGVAVLIYSPTKKVYNDQKMFPGKQLPQHEYRYNGRHAYASGGNISASDRQHRNAGDTIQAAQGLAPRHQEDHAGADQEEDRAAADNR